MSSGRLRLLVGLLVCVALPLGSWLFAGGALAYTMYSATVVYRLEITAYGPRGQPSPIAPSDLARFAGPFAAPFLFGAEKPRELPQIDALRAHLADVGRLACARSTATKIDVVLFEGADADEREARTESVACTKAP